MRIYSTITLAAGIGSGEESIVAQEPSEVQQILNPPQLRTMLVSLIR